jgi:hypothetical protein
MQTLAMLTSLSLLLALFSQSPQANLFLSRPSIWQSSSSPPASKQLLAVRGVITKKQNGSKGLLQITIKPAKDFAEVTITVRENDLVGSAPSRANGTDLPGLLGNEANGNETITAAELDEGDLVSVIYDPQLQNRALEIYLH